MEEKAYLTGDGTIDSADIAAVLRQRKNERDATEREPASWAEAVRSFLHATRRHDKEL